MLRRLLACIVATLIIALPAQAWVHGNGSVLPSGALGDWNAANYNSTFKTITNSVTNGSVDQNLIVAPRRLFNPGTALHTGWWNQSGAAFGTLVDNNQTAPDGSTEASTVTSPGSGQWAITASTNVSLIPLLTNGATYDTCISVKWLGTGSADFTFGANSTKPVKTASASWQRFCQTFTANGSDSMWFGSPDGSSAANFAIVDWQLYAGSSDLNPNALTQKPQVIQNWDIRLDNTAGSTVSGGALKSGTFALAQLTNQLTLSAYTVAYCGQQVGTPTSSINQAVFSDAVNINNFMVGPSVTSGSGGVGSVYNNTQLDISPNDGGATQLFNDYWGVSTPAVILHRYDGANAASFLNGAKLLYRAVAPSPVSILNLQVNSINQTLHSGYDLKRIVFWNRALSDAEAATTYNVLKSSCALTPPSRLVAFVGDSIMLGFSGKSLAYDAAAGMSPQVNAVNAGISGSTGADLVTEEAAINGLLTQQVAQSKPTLVVMIGANDIGQFGGRSGTQEAAFVAAYLDTMRAAGWKVVLCTILPRTNDVDGGTYFNAQRNIANGIYIGWGNGLHYDALADTGNDPTMGPDNAPNNATLYNSKIHPTTVGNAFLPSYISTAVNSIN